MPKITTALKILDSSGQLANGFVEFKQSARYVVPEGLVTTTLGKARVQNGVITAMAGGELTIPETPSDQGVEVSEYFGGNSVTYTVQVPAGAEVEYSDLPVIVPPDAGGGIPSWVQDLLAVPADIEAEVEQAEAAAREATAAVFPASTVITYDDMGNVQTVTQNGVETAYSYNADGSVHTDTRLGVTRTYSYDGSGNLTGIAS